jgi:hypothetical protein
LVRYKPTHRARDNAAAVASATRGHDDPRLAPASSTTKRGNAEVRPTGLRRRWLVVALVIAILGAGGAAAGMLTRANRGAKPRAASSGSTGEHETTATTASPVAVAARAESQSGVTARWVQAENAQAGTDGWKLTEPAKAGEIEGYADHVSVNAGQPVRLFVSTVAPTFHVEAYRMGYYGKGGRLVWHSEETLGTKQAKPVFTPGINMIEDRWEPSLTVSTAGWPEGDYLFKLVADTGQQRYVPLTVRNDQSTATYLIINAVTTWQAYNLYGGYDLYSGLRGQGAKAGSDYAHRSRVVSFDRPNQLGEGAGDFLGLEFPFVNFAESRGLDVTYTTDVDVHEHPELLLKHKAVFTMGHDEYYSKAMRQGLLDARDHGVNLAFLGANTMYRHIRFAPSPLGDDRHEICYKDVAEDPLHGKDNSDVTVDWRDPPTHLPESEIIGDYYQCNPVQADMVISDASDWLFAGTGATNGQVLANVIGSEYDRYDPRVPGPRNVDILTHSPLTCQHKADYSDATYYSAASGAGVFASGTIDFVGNIDTNCQTPNCPGLVLGHLVQNLLVAFGAGPAGVAHPSTGAQPPATPPTPPSTPITAGTSIHHVPRR